MPMRVTATAGGTGYADIRVGHVQVHQSILDVSTLGSFIDANGYIPPGLAVTSTGTPAHASGTVYGVVGPEAVYVVSTSAADVFGNVILAGVLNGDMIEDNVGSALAGTLPAAIRVI